MTPEKWVLEIYREHSLALNWAFRRCQNRGRRFIVRGPEGATAADRIARLDLRAQGFDIAVGPPA